MATGHYNITTIPATYQQLLYDIPSWIQALHLYITVRMVSPYYRLYSLYTFLTTKYHVLIYFNVPILTKVFNFDTFQSVPHILYDYIHSSKQHLLHYITPKVERIFDTNIKICFTWHQMSSDVITCHIVSYLPTV